MLRRTPNEVNSAVAGGRWSLRIKAVVASKRRSRPSWEAILFLLLAINYLVAEDSAARTTWAAAAVDVDWSYGVKQRPVSIKVGTSSEEQIRLVYGPGAHDVYLFPNKAAYKSCDFSNAVEVCGTGVSECSVKPPTTGTWYYGCKVSSHCSNGRMRIRVSARPTAVVKWSYGKEQNSISVRSGDTIRFKYGRTGGPHTLYRFPSKEAFEKCRFAMAVGLCSDAATNPDRKFCDIRAGRAGAYYLGCNAPGHCRKGGMKISVSVENK